jgi:broad specificity phosphatase PhoE
MTTLYLVRHAKPAATWGDAVDPGLDAEGTIQAQRRAGDLNARLANLAIYSSPLKRCIETARPLAELWGVAPKILPAVAEIPSPPLLPAERRAWLTAGMQGTWPELQASSPSGSPDYLAWRTTLLDALRALSVDSVIYTHYIAINVAVCAAQGNEHVLSFKPGHASVTTLEVTSGCIAVRELGQEADQENVLLGR